LIVLHSSIDSIGLLSAQLDEPSSLSAIAKSLTALEKKNAVNYLISLHY
jgi:hypothetical protein